MDNLKAKIDSLLDKNDTTVIAIDGRSGSGKTTLATHLASEYGAAIIHMDHFFLPPELRREKRVNVHFERFLNEVYPSLKKRIPFSYRIFNCAKMDYDGVVKIGMSPLIIIEGAYSLLPMWDDILNLRIFYDIDETKQRERILKRNGEEGYRNFKEKWIPLEESYFLEYNIKERCDVMINQQDIKHESIIQ